MKLHSGLAELLTVKIAMYFLLNVFPRIMV